MILCCQLLIKKKNIKTFTLLSYILETIHYNKRIEVIEFYDVIFLYFRGVLIVTGKHFLNVLAVIRSIIVALFANRKTGNTIKMNVIVRESTVMKTVQVL